MPGKSNKPEKTVLITGATGMVGKGVLLECLEDSRIHSVTLISRSPINIRDPKIKEILLDDFTKMDTIKSRIDKADACYHCMGVSAAGMKEKKYSKLTYDVTAALADTCYEINPGMTFTYVSGAGTDSSENGRIMWARVKGKAENYILAKGFGKVCMFRPGMIIPEKGIRSRTKLYQAMYNLLRPMFPWLKNMKNITTTTKLGKTMIHAMLYPDDVPRYLNNREINRIALIGKKN